MWKHWKKFTGILLLSILVPAAALAESSDVIFEDETWEYFEEDLTVRVQEDSDQEYNAIEDDIWEEDWLMEDDSESLDGISEDNFIETESTENDLDSQNSGQDSSEEYVDDFVSSTDGFGDCGKEEGTVFWELDERGTLHIYGSGDMKDWANADEVPWKQYTDRIIDIDIQDGVTGIGSYAFTSCMLVKEVTIG